jgi:hypothetical protein
MFQTFSASTSTHNSSSDNEEEEEEKEEDLAIHCSSCDEEIVPLIPFTTGYPMKRYCDTEYIHKYSMKPWPSRRNDPHWPHSDYSHY